nr:Putative uncharacterized protein [Moritella viscosa]SHO15792.1 Putative uncharacterized protein [Moritella viscosa]SHO17638.1 Putative uncharacterized protein [Moritella viscosa]SHO19001.1 Putative uncharacterized protein [Moritella viscosa]
MFKVISRNILIATMAICAFSSATRPVMAENKKQPTQLIGHHKKNEN